MSASKAILDQLLKDFDKSPGWLPLLLLVLIVVELVHLPANIHVFGREVLLSGEVLASAVTLILYLLGDAIDELIFKERHGDEVSTRERYKKKYATESSTAQAALGVDAHGLYALALKLSHAAEKERESISIHFANEMAKFLRSLITPLAFMGFYCLCRCRWVTGAILLLSSAAAFFWYPLLKVFHIRRLYSSAAGIAEDRKKFRYREADGVRLFFWDGKFVEAGLPPAAKT